MHTSDDLFLGAAQTAMGVDPALGNPSPMGTGVGPMGRIYVWDTVPLAAVANNVALVQSPAAAGDLVLTAGTGTTLVNGRVTFDVPRAVVVTVATAAAPVTVFGFDQYGQPMSQTFATITTSATSTKAFKSVSRVSTAGALTAVTVGTTDVLGLPLRVTDPAYIASVKYAGVIAQDAGTFVAAVTTSPATALTGDVRGTYLPSSATDGVKRLVMAILVPAIASGPNATRIGALGVTQA
jgi:hypothetical protein